MVDEDKLVYDWEKLCEELNKDFLIRLKIVVVYVLREWEVIL